MYRVTEQLRQQKQLRANDKVDAMASSAIINVSTVNKGKKMLKKQLNKSMR